ncbi:MAG: DUF5329 domain-containing protein [Planctomycetes bacterium]|nr:DUF5329 domain-containing protein [Planctomycetota bacterium]
MSASTRIAGCVLLLSALVCEAAAPEVDRLPSTAVSADAVSGQVSIRLSNISNSLLLPPPKGANWILSASVRGGAVRSVWLAPSAISSARVSLTKVDRGEYQVNLYGRQVFELLKGQTPDGEFRIFAETSDGAIVESIAVRYTMRTPPKHLDFEWDRATVTIYQRCFKPLPGSHGNLRLHIGDITAGQVLVSVHCANQNPLVDMASLREGDSVRLDLEEKDYVLVLDRLVNLLLGRDYAVFSLVSADAWEQSEIERLLTLVGESEHIFLRTGDDTSGKRVDQELKGDVFSTLLRQKLSFATPRVVSVNQFIEQIASRSWTSGKPYQVRLSNGDTVAAAIWLRQRLEGEEETGEEFAIEKESSIETDGDVDSATVPAP